MVTREESLTIRFSALEMQEIAKLAEEEARSKGAMVRKLVDEALAARRVGLDKLEAEEEK